MALVQPIIVDVNGSHEDTIWAAAYASLAIYQFFPGEQNWDEWINSKFTKSVRRATLETINKITAQVHPSHTVHAGLAAKATAFLPMLEPFPKLIARCQVSGTDFPREGFPAPPTSGYVIAINPDVEMTTGKTAAQVAHAHFGFYLKHLLGTQHPVQITDDRSVFEHLAHADLPTCKIHDAGFTEVEPNTLTCISGIL